MSAKEALVRSRRRKGPTSLRLRWWREVFFIGAFYGAYTVVRNFGIATDSTRAALRNAERVIAFERALGFFNEETIQRAFLDWRWFIQFWNVFYGTAHFVVTIIATALLFRREPTRYRVWRNTLAVTMGLSLVSFTLFPLMPPRLLAANGLPFGFVDTLKEYGGLWSFDSGAVAKVSNQYAAMPSLHFAWALWSACALAPMAKSRWAKAAATSYPLLTLFAIVVTANHYWIDALGGAAVLAAGHLGGQLMSRWFPNALRRLR